MAFYGIAFAYQALTPLYTGAGWYGDWWESYEIVQFYLGQRDPGMVFFEHDTIPSRPPAYHLLLTFPQAFILKSILAPFIFKSTGYIYAIDTRFVIFALASVLPGIAFFWPACLLAQKILKGKGLEIFPYLLIFSPFLTQSSLYPWSKMLSVFYFLLAINFYWDFWTGKSEEAKSNLAWAGFWSAWAYLAHPTALFYIAGMGIFAWWRSRGKVRLTSTSLSAIGCWLFPALLVLLPWHVWVAYQYGLAAPLTANPSWAHQGAVTWGEALGIRVVNFFGNLFPIWFFQYLGGMFTSPESLPYRLYLLYSGFLRYYYNVLPGALTTTLAVLIIYYLFRKEEEPDSKPAPTIPFAGLIQKYRSLKNNPQPLGFFLFILVLCGFWGVVLIQPYKTAEGLTAQGMALLVIIMLLLGAYVLASLTPLMRVVLAGVIFLEFLVVRGSHLFFLNQGFLGGPGDRNLALKKTYNLFFPADALGGAGWFFLGLFLTLGTIMAILFLSKQKQEKH